MNMDSKRWYYLLACMFICVCTGFGYTWSVFQKPIASQFGWSTADVSLTFTLSVMMSALVPPFIGKLQDYIKTRQVILIGGALFGISVVSTGYIKSLAHLYLAFGIGVGLGIGIVYPCIMAYIIKLFPDKRGLASGMLAASYGSGAIIWAPIGVRITETYGVLAAFKVLGIIFFIIVCLLSLVIKDIPENYQPVEKIVGNENRQIVSGPDKTWKEMLKNPLFYIIVGMFSIGTTSGLMIMGHASPIVQEVLKISPERAALIVGLLAIANTMGRLIFGWVSDKIGRFPIIFTLFVMVGSAMFALSVVKTFALFVAMILIIGLGYGGFVAMMAPLTADTFGSKHLSVNYGFMYVAYGFGGLLGPRLAATLKDLNNGDYSQAFLIAALLCIVGIVLAFFASKYNRKSRSINLVETLDA